LPERLRQFPPAKVIGDNAGFSRQHLCWLKAGAVISSHWRNVHALRLPKMVLHYRDDKSEYCTEMYEQAMRFLTENKLEKSAAELKAKTEVTRALVTCPHS
jgi:hypothetical protein